MTELQAKWPKPATKLRAAQKMPLRHNFTLQVMRAGCAAVNWNHFRLVAFQRKAARAQRGKPQPKILNRSEQRKQRGQVLPKMRRSQIQHCRDAKFPKAKLELGLDLRGAPVKLNTSLRVASVLLSMNTRSLPSSILLLAIGAGAVLLIGAFARFDPVNSTHAAAPAPNPAALTEDDPPPEASAEGQLPADLSPGLAEIIKLAQAHVDESVILAYVKNSGQVFSPTADEILYLSDLGLSQEVIGLLVKSAPPEPPAMMAQEAPATAPLPTPTPLDLLASASQPQPDANTGMFFNDLGSYGTWSQQPDLGLVWQPTVETIVADWRPYVDGGQWLYSDCGWYWQSDYTWGWAAFHYGRWARVPRLGWVWAPDNIWSPAWVAWRSASDAIGWAPLPPGVGLNVLAQLTYLGHLAGPNPTFGLTASAYTFVNTGNLTSRHLPHHVLAAARVNYLVRNTVVIDGYALVNNKIFNGGVSRETVSAASSKPVPEVALRSVSSPRAAGLALDRKTLAVYVPAASSPGASSAKTVAMNNSRAEAPTERVSSQESMTVADNDPAETAMTPGEQDGGQQGVELPPLHYPATPAPQVLHPRRRDTMIAAAAQPAPAHHVLPRGYAGTMVEHPSTPAPRLDAFNLPARQNEMPQPTMENRPVQPEYRPAQVEAPRAAPPPPALAPITSRSGK